MNWSAYLYLVGILLACVAALGIIYHLMPALLRKSRSRSIPEMVVLALVVGLGLATIYLNFYSGRFLFAYLDVGNDTSEQYLPYYCNMLDAIRSGSFGAWNHEYGLGASFVSFQSWTLDPFNLVLIPLGLALGNDHIALVLVIVQSLKVLVTALLTDHLLTYYCDTPLARVLGAVLCSFSGYLMLWGQHYWLGTVFVMAALLPLLLERLMERQSPGRFLALAVGVALSIASSVYSGFMVMLFATAYALLRVAYVTGGKPLAFLNLFGRLTVPVLCGILLAMVFIVPYASLMLGESTRVVGSSESSLVARMVWYLKTFVPKRWLPMILSRAMGNGLVSYGSDIPVEIMPPTEGFSYVNVYEIIMLGLSGAVFILLSQFVSWTLHEANGLAKVLIVLASALIVLYCTNFFLPAFSNALVAPKYRSSFAVVIPLCIAMAVGFDRRVATRTVDRVLLVLSAMLSFVVVGWSLWHTIDGRLACLWYLLAICVTTVLLWMLSGTATSSEPAPAHGSHARMTDEGNTVEQPAELSARLRLVFALCCAAIVSMSIVDGFFSTNNRAFCSAADALGSQTSERDADTREALAWLRDYDSTFWRAEKLYADWTYLNDALTEHYRGVSSYNSTLDADVEEFYSRLWPEALGGDIAYQVYRKDPNEPALLNVLGVKYLLSQEPVTWDWCRELTKCGDVYVYRNMNADSILTLRSGCLSESEAASLGADELRTMLPALAIVPDEEANRLDPATAAEITKEDLSSLDLSWMDLDEWMLDENGQPVGVPMSQAKLTSEDGISVSGTLFANTDSMACLAIPHVSGWTIRIDGEEVPTFRANYGFIGFIVPAGVHQIEATYAIPHLLLGAGLSLAGVIATIICCVVSTSRARRKAEEEA